MRLPLLFAGASLLTSLAVALPASSSDTSTTTSITTQLTTSSPTSTTTSHSSQTTSSSLATGENTSATSTITSSSTTSSTSTAPTSTHTRNPDPPFQVRNLTIKKHVGGDTSIRFRLHDPSEYGRASTVCNATWTTGSKGYPQTTYSSCINDSFAWNMKGFTTIRSFQLGLEHEYVDPLVGSYPYDVVDNFAMANMTEQTMVCTTKDHTTVCQQHENGVVLAPIYATIA